VNAYNVGTFSILKATIPLELVQRTSNCVTRRMLTPPGRLLDAPVKVASHDYEIAEVLFEFHIPGCGRKSEHGATCPDRSCVELDDWRTEMPELNVRDAQATFRLGDYGRANYIEVGIQIERLMDITGVRCVRD